VSFSPERAGVQAGSCMHFHTRLVKDGVKCPGSFKGKTRFTIELPREASQDEIREAVLSADEAQKWLEGKTPKKVIIVPGRIINIVL